MQHKLLHESDGQRTFAVVLDTGDEVMESLQAFAEAPSGGPALHAHLVVGKRDGTAMAGHLGEAHVRPTLEVILTESPAHLRKAKDPQSGLALIRPELMQ